MANLNPAYRTIRLMYRVTKTRWFVTLFEGLSFVAFIFAIYQLTVFACVGLHGADVCFN